jgi:hypothetical protein
MKNFILMLCLGLVTLFAACDPDITTNGGRPTVDGQCADTVACEHRALPHANDAALSGLSSSTVVRPSSTVVHPPSTVVRPSSTVVHPPSTVVRPSSSVYAQIPTGSGGDGSYWGWLKKNYAMALTMLFFMAEGVVRITPSEKDDSIVNWVKRQVDKLLPNKTKDGGEHI